MKDKKTLNTIVMYRFKILGVLCWKRRDLVAEIEFNSPLDDDDPNDETLAEAP